jgi:hypothetical protein
MNTKLIPALLCALATGTMLAGCSDLSGSDRGRVRLVMSSDNNGNPSIATDAAASVAAANGDDDRNGGRDERPSRWFTSANVTLSSILVRTLDGELIPLDIDLPVSVDVVRIEGGRQIELPEGLLPPDTYDQVVVVMTAVQGTTRDGTLITIEPPGGGWTAIIPVCPLEVAEGETELIGLKLQVNNALRPIGNRWSFHPQFRSAANCVDNEG